jgi:hypothetical protein
VAAPFDTNILVYRCDKVFGKADLNFRAALAAARATCGGCGVDWPHISHIHEYRRISNETFAPCIRIE